MKTKYWVKRHYEHVFDGEHQCLRLERVRFVGFLKIMFEYLTNMFHTIIKLLRGHIVACLLRLLEGNANMII